MDLPAPKLPGAPTPLLLILGRMKDTSRIAIS